jgi:hypothetical protein
MDGVFLTLHVNRLIHDRGSVIACIVEGNWPAHNGTGRGSNQLVGIDDMVV